MSEYEQKDALMLKECMRIIAEIVAKHPHGAGMYLSDCPQHIKDALEFYTEMLKQTKTEG